MPRNAWFVTILAAVLAGAAGFAAARFLRPVGPPGRVAATPEKPADPEAEALRRQVADLAAERDRLRDELRASRETPLQPEARPAPLPASPAVEAPKANAEAPPDAAPQIAHETAPGAASGHPLDELRQQAVADLADPEKSERAAMFLAALAAKGDAGAIAAMVRALGGDNADAREQILDVLDDERLMGNPELAQAVSALMQDPSAGVRARVAESLSHLPADVAGPLLQSMLGDSDAKVLRKAAAALGKLKYADAGRELAALTRHADASVAWEAAYALHRAGDSSYVEAYVPVYGGKTRSADARERLDGVKQLRRLKLESARPWLAPLVNDADPAVAKEAAKAIKDLDQQLKK